ncbi:MAG TPA: 2-C-methyl-D-erythritol 4-phosphate cytidylyltransferase, partial [Thermomicrobiales bacterium]|nr:2-C-methyl-D-erythritol 4-phosphate cytidylyltransferase [Thermomicrobiales bacterium]
MSASPVAAVVVAGGRGERLGDPAKCLLPLAGRPMLAWSLDALEQAASVAHVVVVAGVHTRIAVEALVAGMAWPKVVAVVAGGERRQDSVAAGLAAVPTAAAVLVHDAARPLAEPAVFDRCAAAAIATGAAIAAVPVADTLKRVTAGRATATVDRAGLWAAQTPQGFRQDIVERLLPLIRGADTVTDEARLCESLGVPVAVVPGSPANLKVTLPDDVAVAAALLRARTGATSPPTTRSGIGYDVHRLVSGRRLVLGGVEIAHERGLE